MDLIGKIKDIFAPRTVGGGKVITADRYSGGQYRVIFDGEKNLGELGPIKDYYPGYEELRARSWQAMLESEIAQIVVGRYVTWIIGEGLKLQAEPNNTVLTSEGYEINSKDFKNSVEARYKVWSNSSVSDYTGMTNKNVISNENFLNSIVGGDVLVIYRYENNAINIQLIDGCHVSSPMYGSEWFPQALSNGNRIEHGVELSPKNEHVAYYVRKYNNPIGNFEHVRIPAVNTKTGLRMARLVYGSKHRIDNVRGLPLLSVVLETAKKLERYKEATVGSAEERQKIPYTVEHQLGSTGDSPFLQQMAIAQDLDRYNGNLPTDTAGKELADKVAATTNKMVFNLPINASLKALESKSELHFKDFYSVNIDLVCAALGIPPNVALQKYDENFSASRAALKDWEHSMKVRRRYHSVQFEQPTYELFLHTEILRNKIIAPGYLIANAQGDYMVLGAYRAARFTGANVPHIDPLKEVQAERLKLGTTGAHLPLTTLDVSTEKLNEGDSETNMSQYAEELDEAEGLGIEAMPEGGGALPADESKSKD